MHIFDLVALDEVPTMLVDVWIPCIGAGKAETIAFSSALVRRNGGILPVRGLCCALNVGPPARYAGCKTSRCYLSPVRRNGGRLPVRGSYR
jgi:hypothetical protein